MALTLGNDQRALKRATGIVRNRLRLHSGDYRLEPLPGDASTRHYLRLSLSRTHIFATAVLMLFDRPFRLEKSDYYQLSELMRKIYLPVPLIYEAFERDGAMLIEDLGDTSLFETVPLFEADEGALEEYYRKAIDSLVTLQTRAAHYSLGVRAFGRAFDEKKLLWELRFTMRHFARRLADYKPSGAARRALNRFFDDLCSRIAVLPRVLCHRDFHSRNLMVRRDKLFIIDFQDARMGPHVYDLVSLLRDSYVQLPPGVSSRLFDYYLREHPVLDPAGRDSLGAQFNLIALQRHLKHLGTFGYQACIGRRAYLKFVLPTLRYLEENLSNFPEYGEAAGVLGDLFEKSRAALGGED